MAESYSLVFNITIALLLAGVGGVLASALRQPPIIGYLAAGVAIGPFTPGFVGDRDSIAALADVGVIFLMFALGVTFSVNELKRVGRVAIWATVYQLTLTILGGLLIAVLLDIGRVEGLIVGCAIAATSSMVILKNLLDRGEAASGHGRLLMSMSIVQDIVIVILIVLLPLLTQSESATLPVTERLGEVGWVILKAALFIGASIFIGVRAVPAMMGYITRLHSSELFILMAAVIALGVAALSSSLGLSAALGAFLAGLMLAESEFDHRVIAEVVPMRDLFATLFFVSVGSLIDIHYLIEHWRMALGFAVLVLLIKLLSTFIALLPFKLTPRTATFTALGMVPVGELNFLLAQRTLSSGSLSEDSYKLILAAALFTIVAAPSLLNVAPFIARRIGQWPVLWRLFDPHASLVGQAGGLEAHAVLIGYGRVGHRIAEGLRAAGMPLVVIESRIKRVREATADGIDAIYGSAATLSVLQAACVDNARLVLVALADHDSTLAVIRQVRSLNPTVSIAARAEQIEHEEALKQAGAALVVVPELAGAHALLDETLDMLGMPR